MMEEFREEIEYLFKFSESNRLPESFEHVRIFDLPLIGIAPGEDGLYSRFKVVVGPEHLAPIELWQKNNMPKTAHDGESLLVVSIIFPFTERIRSESLHAVKIPADFYCFARNFAIGFMAEVVRTGIRFLEEHGYHGIGGMYNPVYQMIASQDPPRLYSNWSERHMAFAAGLGTFSLHDGFISEKGCNIRIASILTDAPFEATPRKTEDPYGNCLYYTRGICRECEKRCPGEAIDQKGHNILKCLKTVKEIEAHVNERFGPVFKPDHKRMNGVDSISYPVGCAFCQFGTPCMDKNPVKGREYKKGIRGAN